MANRMHKVVVRGEIDNTVRGKGFVVKLLSCSQKALCYS